MYSRRLVLMLVLVVTLALLLTACGGKGSGGY
jgi:predicted small lipoprotein YifL